MDNKGCFLRRFRGFFLYTPDFKPVSIDAKQLLYLIEDEYVDYFILSATEISNKNKVDFFLRTISISNPIAMPLIAYTTVDWSNFASHLS
ncbi:uncharacterized protein RAG0_04606 [Rhynchosporium agropyri]|uniref:Uncharacterized protein n=1 Tax=Rhynchosporium agropyri TaxID=914238 RepID=A0A1E1K9K6_9HELO|nr:uncharacterized protein RAG0_04606 [Rhynchosporium agropyri]